MTGEEIPLFIKRSIILFISKYIVLVGQAFRPAYCKSVRLETEAEALPYEM